MGYDGLIMPSWNIHTALVEHMLSEHRAEELGIPDVNAFLFGNYVPDVYVGFMVQNVTFRIDYCLTHAAEPDVTPMPDADWFWDRYVARRTPEKPANLSLALGAWAHLVADRFYNGYFRAFCQENDVPEGEELRIAKQSDFDLFGRSLSITSRVEATPELLEAARTFKPYSVLADDVARCIEIADAIVDDGGLLASNCSDYSLLDAQWMEEVFQACSERLAVWLAAWLRLVSQRRGYTSAEVRHEAGLPSALRDDPK